jgi:hypothetical protein
MNPHPSPSPNLGKMPIRVTALALALAPVKRVTANLIVQLFSAWNLLDEKNRGVGG